MTVMSLSFIVRPGNHQTRRFTQELLGGFEGIQWRWSKCICNICLFGLIWSGGCWWLLVVVGGIILLLFTNNPRATDCLLEILPTFSHSPQSLIIYDNLAHNFSNTPLSQIWVLSNSCLGKHGNSSFNSSWITDSLVNTNVCHSAIPNSI